MVGKVHYGRGVTLCREGKPEFVLLAPLVARDDLEIAGITHLAVFREVHELYCVSVFSALPDLVLEALGSAVEVIGAVVDRKAVDLAVDLETAFGDTIGVPSGAKKKPSKLKKLKDKYIKKLLELLLSKKLLKAR